MKNNYYLVYSKALWKQIARAEDELFKFSDKEIEVAEKRDDGFLGFRNGIKCYLPCLVETEE